MPETIAAGRPSSSPTIDGYLDALLAALDLPGDERLEVRDEIGAHLFDLRSELVETGLTDDAAAQEALRRLGPPEFLGREMTLARQTRRALLAAVGGATLAATGAAFRGLILGIAAVMVVAMVGMLAMAVATRLFGDGTWTLFDAGWYTAFAVAASWVSAWLAGRALVSVAARRSHRPAGQVRPWAAAIGGAVVAWLALAWFTAPQNVFSAIALAFVPAVFVAAALTGTDRPVQRSGRARVASLALLVTVAISIPLLFWVAATPVETRGQLSSVSPAYASMQDLLRAIGFDMPGRFVADPPELGAEGWTIDHGMATASLGGAPAVTARWHDVRLEAWRAIFSTGALDRAYPAPFASAPIAVQSDKLVGSVRVDRTRGVSQWDLVVTGIAADGARDLIVTLGGSNSTFTGSAWDWLTAP